MIYLLIIKLNVEECIDKYKNYAKSYLNNISSIEEDLAVRTFIEVHKNTNRVEPVSYMSIKKINPNTNRAYNEFAAYNPLSQPLEVLGVTKKKVTNIQTGKENKNNQNKDKSYSKNNNYNKNNHRSKNVSIHDDGDLINNPFAAALKNYK